MLTGGVLKIKEYLIVVWSAVVRNILIEVKYKFRIATDITWLFLDILVFTVLGMFIEETSIAMDMPVGHYLLVGVLFWAFFHRSFIDTSDTIPEEASRGTIGFLVTNNVNMSTLLIARYISSSILTFIYAMVCVFPVLWYFDIFNFSLSHVPHIIILVLLTWIFMLVMSFLFASLNILFKRIQPLTLLILTTLKVISGYWIPIEAFEMVVPGATGYILATPIGRGLHMLRSVMVNDDIQNFSDGIKIMIIGTLIMAAITFAVYRVLERKSRSWGTLEFY